MTTGADVAFRDSRPAALSHNTTSRGRERLRRRFMTTVDAGGHDGSVSGTAFALSLSVNVRRAATKNLQGTSWLRGSVTKVFAESEFVTRLVALADRSSMRFTSAGYVSLH